MTDTKTEFVKGNPSQFFGKMEKVNLLITILNKFYEFHFYK